ncbi:DUF2971 domain-containing protein [Janthinobacterium sp. P210006]|uniref:DUF2971 domain-containing protein n=1 Tax=Janthinobacterium sp. P210006 TaxID=3112939 RepID=UPI002E255D5A|nr:DUF2971 domain-containing protein [Janthinobacterium sp. P210006]
MHFDYSSKDAEQHIRNGITDLNLHTPEQVDEITKRILESKHQINENSNIEKSLDNTGILSLASSWDNILLWSHYAKHHTGICIGFNRTKDVFRTAQKVSYYSDFPIIMRPQDSPDTILEKTFLRKSLCWAYEKEWRVIRPQWSNDEKNEFFKRNENSRIHRFVRDFDGPNTYKFKKKSIIDVTLGMNVNDEDEKKVIAAIKAANINIKLYKASREKDRYKVKRVEISI